MFIMVNKIDFIDLNILLFFFILNFFFYIFHNHFFKIFNLYDKPNKRKIHNVITACSGGIFIIINIFILLLFFILDLNELSLSNIFIGKKQLYSFLLTSLFFLLFGVGDDKYNFSANKKFFWFTIIIFQNCVFDSDLRINTIYFTDSIIIDLHSASLIFTIISILAFINFFNMFDGINLQSIIYSFIIFCFFIYNNVAELFFIILTLCLMPLLYLNYRGKVFLGNNGIYLLGYLISYFIIKSYNLNAISVEDIMLIIMIPFLDMLRLIIIRTINNKNIFEADKDHIHHIFLKKFGLLKTNIIIQLSIALPLILSTIYQQKIFFIFVIFIVYTILIYSLKKN